jgi:hypothetical protein
MNMVRRAVLGVVLLLSVTVGLRVLMALTEQRGVAGTRALAVAFLMCDLAISASLVILLVTHERRAPDWAERRLPYRGRWLWYLLIGLTILSYAALAPTFLFLLVQLKRQ